MRKNNSILMMHSASIKQSLVVRLIREHALKGRVAGVRDDIELRWWRWLRADWFHHGWAGSWRHRDVGSIRFTPFNRQKLVTSMGADWTEIPTHNNKGHENIAQK